MKTIVSIEGSRFHIDGRPTYPGRQWKGMPLEGLLMNSRMANAIAEDHNPATRGVWAYLDGPWDAERNTREFCEALPTYRRHGLLAVGVNLQGGSPQGYSQVQPWHISGFEADGALKPDWTARLSRVLEATDRLGMVVILGLFYGAATRHLRDEAAVVRAVDESVDWLVGQGATNVLLEIGNEVDNPVFHHRIVEAPRCHELIVRAQQRSAGKLDTPAGRLLVGASLLKPRTEAHNIIGASDFLLPHGNHVNGMLGREQSNPDGIRLQLMRLRQSPAYRGQPVLYNEDDHYDFDAPDNHMLAAIEGGAGWGFFDYRRSRERLEEGFQSLPVDWSISSERKRAFFRALREASGATGPVDLG